MLYLLLLNFYKKQWYAKQKHLGCNKDKKVAVIW